VAGLSAVIVSTLFDRVPGCQLPRDQCFPGWRRLPARDRAPQAGSARRSTRIAGNARARRCSSNCRCGRAQLDSGAVAASLSIGMGRKEGVCGSRRTALLGAQSDDYRQHGDPAQPRVVALSHGGTRSGPGESLRRACCQANAALRGVAVRDNRLVQPEPPFPCPCCGEWTLPDPSPSFEICSECGWQDDTTDPDERSGANGGQTMGEHRREMREGRWPPPRTRSELRRSDQESRGGTVGATWSCRSCSFEAHARAVLASNDCSLRALRSRRGHRPSPRMPGFPAAQPYATGCTTRGRSARSRPRRAIDRQP
jgi:hypothetical protein